MPLLPLPAIYQESPHTCAEAAALCVLRFHGIVGVTPRFASPTDGADPRQIEAALRGKPLYLSVVSGEMEVEDLKWFCGRRRPPITLVQWGPDQPSHFVVVRGVSHGAVFCHDVETGPLRVPIKEWLPAWRAGDGRMGEVFRNWGIVAAPPLED